MAHDPKHIVSDDEQPWARDRSVPAPPDKELQALKLQKQNKLPDYPRSPFDLFNPNTEIPDEAPRQSPLPGDPTQSPIEKHETPDMDTVYRSIVPQTIELGKQMFGGLREMGGRAIEAVGGEPEEGSAYDAVVAWMKEGGRDQALKAHHELEKSRPKNMTFWQEAISTAGTSLGQQLPYYLLAILTKGKANVAVAGFGIQEFGRAYADAKNENPYISESKAISHAFVSGILESGTEMGPAKVLFAPGTGGFSRLLNFMMLELPGENIAEVGQLLSEYIHGLREDITAKEVLDTMKLTSAATLLAGGAQSLASSTIHGAMERMKNEPKPRTGEALKLPRSGGANLKLITAEGDEYIAPAGQASPPQMRGEDTMYTRGRRIPDEADMKAIVAEEQKVKDLAEEEQRLEGEISKIESELPSLSDEELMQLYKDSEHAGKLRSKSEIRQMYVKGDLKNKPQIQPQMTQEELDMIEEDKRYWSEREHRPDLYEKDQDIPDRPRLTMADMEGMAPAEKKYIATDDVAVDYFETENGIFAMHNGREVGFALKLGEDPKHGFDVSVSREWSRKGVGGHLFNHFMKRNPGYPTGGLTRAGAGMVNKARGDPSLAHLSDEELMKIYNESKYKGKLKSKSQIRRMAAQGALKPDNAKDQSWKPKPPEKATPSMESLYQEESKQRRPMTPTEKSRLVDRGMAERGRQQEQMEQFLQLMERDKIREGRIGDNRPPRTGVQDIDAAVDQVIHGEDMLKVRRASNLLRKRIRPAVRYKLNGVEKVDKAKEGEGHLNLMPEDFDEGTLEWGYQDLQSGDFYDHRALGGLDATDLMSEEETRSYLAEYGLKMDEDTGQPNYQLSLGLNEPKQPKRIRQPRKKEWWESDLHKARRKEQIKAMNASPRRNRHLIEGQQRAIERLGRNVVHELHEAFRALGNTITWVRAIDRSADEERKRLGLPVSQRRYRTGYGGTVMGSASLGVGGGRTRIGIVLNADTESFDPRHTIGHEYGHIIAGNDPTLYNELSAMAEVNWAEAMEKSHHSHMLAGGITPEKLNAFKEEILNDVLGQQLFTEPFIERVAKHDMEFATDLLGRVKKIWVKIKTVFKDKPNIYRQYETFFKNYDQLLDKWAEVVAKYQKNPLRQASTKATTEGYYPAYTSDLGKTPKLDNRHAEKTKDFLEALRVFGEGTSISIGTHGYTSLTTRGSSLIDEIMAEHRRNNEEVNEKMSEAEIKDTGFEPWERDLEAAFESGDKERIKAAVKAAADSAPSDQNLLGIDSNAKTIKGQEHGFLTGIMYLSPASSSGFNLCPWASPGCIASCLNVSGQGKNRSVQRARLQKTMRMKANKTQFLQDLKVEIEALKQAAYRKGFTPVVRLNGTSDEAWESGKYKLEGKSIMEHFPDVQFYDYTKSGTRVVNWAKGKLPHNYHLTFSRSETNDAEAVQVLKAGGTVAVVFRDGLPKTWKGFPVVNGDASDLRHRDPKGVVVGLVAKGEGKKDTSGFVVDLPFEDLVYRPPMGAAEKDLYKAGAEYDIALNRYMLKRKPSESALEKVVGKNPKATEERRAAVLKRWEQMKAGKYKAKPWVSALERARRTAAKKKYKAVMSSDILAGLNALKQKRQSQDVSKDDFSKDQGRSDLTAITRNKPSAPMRYLSEQGLLEGRTLDYGSGKGYDAEHFGMDKYDPNFAPQEPKGNYDTITSNFVLNVLNAKERREVIRKVKDLLRPGGTAYFSVRRDIKQEGTTSRGTYQETVTLPAPFELVKEQKGGYAIYKYTKDTLNLRTEKIGPGVYEVTEFDALSGDVAARRTVQAPTPASAKLKYQTTRRAGANARPRKSR